MYWDKSSTFFGFMNSSRRPVIVTIIASLTLATLSVNAGERSSQQPKLPLKAEDRRQRQALTVRVMANDQNGSGVIIHADQNGTWVVTNRHVVGSSKSACIATASGALYEAAIYSRRDSVSDLAFALIAGSGPGLPTATLATGKYKDTIATVTATGYSAPEYRYTESIGLTLPLLERPVQGGYGLVYSSQVNKGMSGGGVFNQKGELIGINANHSDPLWSSAWLDGKGKPLDKELSEKLDAASVGLTSNLISAEFRRVVQAYVGPRKLSDACEKYKSAT
jgi:S1-C subfamily serine protease